MTPLLHRRTRALLSLAVAALALVVGGAVPGAAQTNKGDIAGVVLDASGAVLAGATVTVTNVQTNVSRTVTTNEDGEYVAALLDAGTYRVEAAASGFATSAVEDVVLRVGDRIGVDVTLQPAGATEEVTITASDIPLVQSETSTRGDTITGRQIVELPLSGRNYTQLATLTPGVSRAAVGVLTDQTAFNQGNPNAGEVPGLGNAVGSTEAARFSRSGGASISANGQRPTNNNFSLDGVDNNEATFGTIGVFPPPDAIAEFKVDTSIPRAEVGRAAGAVINTNYRSGTNEFHGSVYYYGQNSALNATSPVLKGKPANTNDPVALERFLAANEKAVQQIHEFGFTVGGPIIRDRTFFFGDYLGQRNNLPVPFSTTVPTALSRVGNFSEFDAPVFNPVTGEPFPNNIIPNLEGQPGFSPQAFAYLSLFPLPTVNVRNPGPGNPNYFDVRRNEEVIDQFDIKVDHRFSDANSINGRFSYQDLARRRASYFSNIPAGFGAGDEVGDTRQVAISDVHTFSPSVLNEFRFGWTRIDLGILNPGVGGTQGISETFSADLGIPNANRGSFETTGGLLTGGFGTGEFEFSGDGGPFIVNSDNFYFADSLTVIRGSHTFKVGGEYRYRQTEIIDGGRSGNLKGHIQYAADANNGTSTGHVQADYLLGRPATFAEAGDVPGGPFNLRRHEISFFVQDDWKVSPQLTLNLGLRYDIFPEVTEKDDRISNYRLDTGTVIVATDDDRNLIETDFNNFGPRIGFAYNFGDEGQYVVRGGYGLIYTLDGLDLPPLIRNPPFTNQIGVGAAAGINLTTGPPVATSGIDPLNLPTSAVVYAFEPEQSTAYVHQYNLTFEWGFANNWAFNVGYVGNRSRNLLTTRNLGAGGLGIATNDLGQVLENARFYENRARSWYDAFQAQIERRFANGFQARANYTWSKTLDESTGVFSAAGEIRGNFGGPQNPLDVDLEGEKGLSGLHAEHLFTGDIIWELPFGEGRAYLDEGGVVDQIVGGWQVNFLFYARSGQPFTVIAGEGIRADLLRDPYTDRTGLFLDRDAFAFPTTTVTNAVGRTFVVGNTARNQFIGPSIFQTDMSFLKNFDLGITEFTRLEVGMQFFNVFNRANYLVPQNDIRNGDFGRFNNSLLPRTIQYRARFIF